MTRQKDLRMYVCGSVRVNVYNKCVSQPISNRLVLHRAEFHEAVTCKLTFFEGM